MIIDIILIALLVVFIIDGVRRGLIMSLLHTGAAVAGMAVSKLLSQPVADAIYSEFIKSSIDKKLLEIFPTGSVEGELQTWLDSVLAQLPSGVTGVAQKFGFYPDVSKMFSSGTAYSVDYIEEQYIKPIVAGAVAMVAMIVLFAIFTLILRIVCKFINRVITNKNKHPVVNNVNRLLGGVTGLVKGIIPVGIMACAINLLAPVINNASFTSAVADSKICELAANIF